MEQYQIKHNFWQPSKVIFDKYRTRRRCIVRLSVEPVAALAQAWQRLEQDHDVEAGMMYVGGAQLRILDKGNIEVSSSGEDGLDSLHWCINDMLGEALAGSDPAVKVKVISEKIESKRS